MLRRIRVALICGPLVMAHKITGASIEPTAKFEVDTNVGKCVPFYTFSHKIVKTAILLRMVLITAHIYPYGPTPKPPGQHDTPWHYKRQPT